MDFHSYFFGLDTGSRAEFAGRCGSSVGYMLQVAYRRKRIELGLADCIVAVSGGVIPILSLPLTEKAIQQHSIRSSALTMQSASARGTEESKKRLGWRVIGIPPGGCASGPAKPLRDQPYELIGAAEKCRDMALSDGWGKVELVEVLQ